MAAAKFDLVELLKDAEFCAHLTSWEEEFLDDLRGRLILWKGEMSLSEKQMAVLKRIAAKLNPAEEQTVGRS